MHPQPSKVRGGYGHLPSGDPVSEMPRVGADEVALRSTPLAIWPWSTYAIRLLYLERKRSAGEGRSWGHSAECMPGGMGLCAGYSDTDSKSLHLC